MPKTPEKNMDHTVMDSQHKRADWFSKKVAVWNLAGEQKSEVASRMLDDMHIKLEYWSQMFLSILIATLGLLIDATPVVIGAMIIAPILRPISAVSFATSTGNHTLFTKALWVLVMSIIGGIFLAFIIAQVLPLHEVTREIAIRTQPTLIDLGIAFASGCVAFLALGWEKMSAGLAGVAMAASLIPPLAVVGIGIGFGSMSIAWGSAVLFLTNLIAIIIAGIIIFFLFGFYPNQKGDRKRSMFNTTTAIAMMMLLCIPLASTLHTITANNSLNTTISKQAKDFFNKIDPNILVEDIDFERFQQEVDISMSLKAPQHILEKVGQAQQEQLTQGLAEAIGKDIRLEFSIIPVSVVSQSDINNQTPEQRMQSFTQQHLSDSYQDRVYLLNFAHHSKNQSIAVVNFYTDDTSIQKAAFSQAYKKQILKEFPELENIIINRQKTDSEAIPLTAYQENIKDFSSSFSSFFPESTLHKIDLNETSDSITLVISISTPLSTDIFEQHKKERAAHLSTLYDKKVTINSYVDRLEELR